MNKYIDQLNDLMMDLQQSQGETVKKLERAEILELVVTHVIKLKQQGMLAKFRSPLQEIQR